MEERANALREMKICRFCLSEDDPLTNIYEKDGKQSVPLPLQIMACVAIEVFANDGMPQLICKPCRHLTQQAYTFKTTCKRADDALKLFVATGNLTKPQFNKQPITQDDIVPEKSHSKKRGLQEKLQENLHKKKKTSTASEMVTLNYATPLEISRSIMTAEEQDRNTDEGEEEEEEEEEDDDEHILGMDEEVERFEEIVEHNSMIEQNIQEQQGEEDDDDDNINPVLKVPQVQTDVFPCPHCERSFPLKQLLDIHVRNHERERSFACEECGRKFFTKYDLGKHVQTHSDLKPFTCVVCKKQFSRESLLHRHEKIHIDVPKYLCTFCDRTFLTREDLDAHSEKHKKKRPFACRLCNKSFVFKQGLERHELTHADQKPHKCNYCEASFTSPIKLTRHITSHAGLRPYPCKLCGRTFLLSHHLTRHMRSHYAAKSANVQPVGQHKCDVCSMSFRRKDSLINHSAIHSMVNLKCVICNTAFENAKMVKEHITTHLSGLPYPCDRCDYSFETQDQLEEHELKHAEMEYEEQIEKEVSLEVQQAQNEDDEDDYLSGEDEVAEFTITNPDNPEVIRRSKRETKIKNYAQFLKDELGSDLEDEVVHHEDMQDDDEEETIKPVIRMEGTKVYTRKNAPEKPKMIPFVKPPEVETAPLEQITQPQLTTLENLGLTKQAVNALPNKKYVDMKIGDKTVRVQKLMMTRAEIEAMAREGKIEMKGNTILLKNRSNLQDTTNKNSGESVQMPVPKTKPISLQSIIDDTKQMSTISKPIVKKTYIRKVPAQVAVAKENSNVINIKAENCTTTSESDGQSITDNSRSLVDSEGQTVA